MIVYSRGSRRGRLRMMVGVSVTATGLLAAACSDGTPAADSAPLTPFPAPSAVPARTVATADFIGSDACAGCHTDQYRAWSGSTHGTAGGEPAPDVVIAPFDGTPLRFRDGTVVPRRRADDYEFVVNQDGQEEIVLSVDGVIGGAHMIGGGTQEI